LIAGAGAGCAAFAGFGEFLGSKKKVRSLAAIIALVLLIVGGICSVFHLGHPAHFMSAITNLTSFSGISLELIFLGLAVVADIIYLILVNTAKDDTSTGGAKALGVISIILAILFCFFTGHGYMLQSRVGWDNFFLPLSFIFSSFAIAGFLYMALDKANEKGYKNLGIITLVAAILSLICFLVYGFMGMGVADTAGIAYMLLAVIIGGAATSIIGYLAAFKKAGNATFAYVGAVCAIIGGIFIRCFMWAAGTAWIAGFAQALANRGQWM
jgi:anaerobic dimethyl sulfoxide reductase subunit C (anchor subunit)